MPAVIHQMDTYRAVVVYELYTELVYCSKIFKKLIVLRSSFILMADNPQRLEQVKLLEISEDTNVLIEKCVNSVRDNSTRNIKINFDLVLSEEVKTFRRKFESMKIMTKEKNPSDNIESFDGLYTYLVSSTKSLSKDKAEFHSALSNEENSSQAEFRLQGQILINKTETCQTDTKNLTRRVSESPEKGRIKNSLRSNSDRMQEDSLKLSLPVPQGPKSDMLMVPSPSGISNYNDSSNKSNGSGFSWSMRRFVFKRQLKKSDDDK